MALQRLAGLLLRHQLGWGGALPLTTPCGAAAALVHPFPLQQHGQIQWQQHLTQQQQQQQQQQRGMATKKAGGTARQKPDSKSRNLGVKLLHDEVAFPGQIMVRQRGTKYHPGYNVGLGKDHTIFATGVGRVQFSRETVQWLGGRTRERTVVSVVPLNGDWGPDYKELEARLVARRNALKRGMVQAHAREAACYFPLAGMAQRQLQARQAAAPSPAATATTATAPLPPAGHGGKGAPTKPAAAAAAVTSSASAQ